MSYVKLDEQLLIKNSFLMILFFIHLLLVLKNVVEAVTLLTIRMLELLIIHMLK